MGIQGPLWAGVWVPPSLRDQSGTKFSGWDSFPPDPVPCLLYPSCSSLVPSSAGFLCCMSQLKPHSFWAEELGPHPEISMCDFLLLVMLLGECDCVLPAPGLSVVCFVFHPWMMESSLSLSLSLCAPAQSCPTLCTPWIYNPHGIIQAGILEWVAISYSRGSSWHKGWTQSLASPTLAGGFFTTEPPG